jgi:hypothetical protein
VELYIGENMNQLRFGTITTVLYIVCEIFLIIDYTHTASVKNKDETFNINITMPKFNTTQEDQYAFLQYELPDEELTIVGYTPLITMNAAHHMLTFACANPGSNKQIWTSGQACTGNEQVIIHGWARNAPSMTLPDDVGFPIGRNTPYKYIIVNIHYLSSVVNDKSGNQLIMSRKSRKYQAGVMLAGTSQIYLKPKTHSVRTPFSCRYNGPSISIFAARVHAHQWARVNSLYRVRDGAITQIVKGDPQWPQSFYPLPTPIEIQNDDYLIGQCVYDNDDENLVRVGSTHKDEMCNVYAMYSFEPVKTASGKQKTGAAPIHSCWDNEFNSLINLIPHDSEVPPRKPSDIGDTSNGRDTHAEHAMNPAAGIGKHSSLTSNDEPVYDDYMDEVENMRHRNKGSSSFDINKVLTHLGLPDYEYADAQNYDYLLPAHLTYGKDQTVKLHNAKIMSSNLYTCVDSWPDSKSLPSQLGEVGGVALTKGNDELVVFHRGSRKWENKYFMGNYRFRNEAYGPIDEDVLLHIDTRTGQLKSRWGAKMFYMPHGLTIDHAGNYWLTDIAMHQVFMFKSTDLNHPALTVGEMFQPGSGPTQLCRPADVAVMKNGDFFVADGYCNSRIIKFNRKGEYITEWGTPMNGNHDNDGYPLPNQWNIVHSIALNEDAQLLCGADRENYRIQCLNSNTGEFQRQIRVELKDNIGPIYAIEFAPNTNGTALFAVTGGTETPIKKVYMIDARTGDILTSFDSNPHLIAPHDITVSANGREIYVGELASTSANALHKFELAKRKDLPLETFSKRIYLSDKNFRLSLIIMAFFAIPVFLAVCIGCFVRMRNLRKLRRLNTFLSDVKNTGTGPTSVLGDWMNRRKGFEKLDQYSDGENEPLDNDINDEDLPSNSHEENQSNVAFQMGASL